MSEASLSVNYGTCPLMNDLQLDITYHLTHDTWKETPHQLLRHVTCDKWARNIIVFETPTFICRFAIHFYSSGNENIRSTLLTVLVRSRSKLDHKTGALRHNLRVPYLMGLFQICAHADGAP